MYNALHTLAIEEDTIWPEKYRVEGHPRIRDFPEQHPNKILHNIRDEL